MCLVDTPRIFIHLSICIWNMHCVSGNWRAICTVGDGLAMISILTICLLGFPCHLCLKTCQSYTTTWVVDTHFQVDIDLHFFESIHKLIHLHERPQIRLRCDPNVTVRLCNSPGKSSVLYTSIKWTKRAFALKSISYAFTLFARRWTIFLACTAHQPHLVLYLNREAYVLTALFLLFYTVSNWCYCVSIYFPCTSNVNIPTNSKLHNWGDTCPFQCNSFFCEWRFTEGICIGQCSKIQLQKRISEFHITRDIELKCMVAKILPWQPQMHH